MAVIMCVIAACVLDRGAGRRTADETGQLESVKDERLAERLQLGQVVDDGDGDCDPRDERLLENKRRVVAATDAQKFSEASHMGALLVPPPPPRFPKYKMYSEFTKLFELGKNIIQLKILMR
jgi:hypothetical protein